MSGDETEDEPERVVTAKKTQAQSTQRGSRSKPTPPPMVTARKRSKGRLGRTKRRVARARVKSRAKRR